MADPANRRRWMLVGLMSAVGLGLAGYAALFHLGWRYAAVSTYLEVALVCAFMLWTRDALLRCLLVFALVVGYGELAADAFSVVVKQTLVYPPGEPMIWASPLYMPFSWIAVMAQMGFIAWWLAHRMRMGSAMAIMALIGASYVPLFEYLAHSADFWYYRNCPMLAGITPYYVVLAEAIICAALPPLLQRIDERPWTWWIGLGVMESAVIYLGSRLAFALTA
jgi:hypothetical protein